MNISILGKFIHFDIELNTITLKIEFLTPDIQQLVEEAVINQKTTKIKMSLNSNRTKTWEDQKAWYGSIKKILIALDQIPNAENMETLDEDLRLSIFPTTQIEIGRRKIIRPLRMKEQSHQQMQENIKKLHNRYEYLNIDFSDLKGI